MSRVPTEDSWYDQLGCVPSIVLQLAFERLDRCIEMYRSDARVRIADLAANRAQTFKRGIKLQPFTIAHLLSPLSHTAPPAASACPDSSRQPLVAARFIPLA